MSAGLTSEAGSAKPAFAGQVIADHIAKGKNNESAAISPQ
jgi:hypothetical protein